MAGPHIKPGTQALESDVLPTALHCPATKFQINSLYTEELIIQTISKAVDEQTTTDKMLPNHCQGSSKNV